MSDLLLGIDLGTTSVKAGVFVPDGTQLAGFAESYPTRRPASGICEQDPADWIRLIDSAMDQFRASGLINSVRCGALTSQVNTHAFVDQTGTPLRPAILWQDTRATLEARELNARMTDAEKIALLGAPIPIDASNLLARMLWVKRHEPEIWDKTAHVLLPKDYALLHLTGELATDALSNIGLVGQDGNYASKILDLVPGAMERMAQLRAMTSVVGNSGAGFPLANATMDGWVGLVGAGACRENAFAYLSGTSEILGLSCRTVTQKPGIVVFAEAQGPAYTCRANAVRWRIATMVLRCCGAHYPRDGQNGSRQTLVPGSAVLAAIGRRTRADLECGSARCVTGAGGRHANG